jgi:protein-tyrosine phosphatase
VKTPHEALLKEEALSKNIIMVSYRRIPVSTLESPQKKKQKSILDTIDTATADGRKVYVHCRGGIK